MTSTLRRSVRNALRITVAGLCCVGIWNSLQFARADRLFREDDEQSLRKAIHIEPDSWLYYMRLADFDHVHSRELLDTAVRLDRYNALVNVELGRQYEADGDYSRAEKSYLAAYDVDRTYPPRWNLAAYYLRRNNMPAFWSWARIAAQMPPDDIDPLFEICWQAAPDPEKMANTVLVHETPALVHQYVAFLLRKGQFAVAATFAHQLARMGTSDNDRSLLLSVVDRLVAANQATAANALWHSLIVRNWVIADEGVPNNSHFLREPIPVSFDWSFPEYDGLHSWPGPSGLETEFTGSEPEDCTVAEQVVTLAPGDYTMTYTYHSADIPPDAGLHWRIVDASSNSIIATSPDLSSDSETHSTLSFTVPPASSLLWLRLDYQRALGTTRIAGTSMVISTQIKANPKHDMPTMQ
jgi:tetratricopeptide (TPR) repeat protein